MSAATKNLFGKAEFDAMKEGSVFVNTARCVAFRLLTKLPSTPTHPWLRSSQLDINKYHAYPKAVAW